MIARTFGPYEIQDLIGRGGMGDVYRAWDTQRERLVALKLLPEVLGTDGEYLSRFRREQHVAARLREPHVIPIHDYGEIDGRLFIDMRLVDGRNVGELLEKDGAMPPVRAVHLVSQVAEALAAAHADGLVHRDVKPSNVLVTSRDFVYVVDFGIARSVGTTRTSLTITGATVGTLDYMAPERFTNLPIDGRADVYSLACLLHECLTASRPFRGEDLASLMHAHLYSTPPRPSSLAPGVPPAMDEVIDRGMAKHPGDRFDSALDLAAAARDALQATDPVAHHRPSLRSATRVLPASGEAFDTAGGAETAELTPAGSPTSAAEPPSPPPEVTVPRPASPPLPVSAWGVQSADGSHRSVDHLPTSEPAPTTALRPGTPTLRPAPAVAPPADQSSESGPAARRSAASAASSSPVGAPDSTRAGSGPQVHGPGGRRVLRRRLAVVATTVALLAALVAFVVIQGPDEPGAETDATGPTGQAPPTTPAAPPPPASSVPIPAAGKAIDVSATPGYVQVAPNGRFAYVTNRDAGTVTVLDTTLNSVTATIPIEAGPPRFIVFSPNGRTAYVTVYNDEKTVNAVVFLDTATLEAVRTVPVGRRPFAPATTPDGRLLYVPSHDDGEVEVIDTATGDIVDRIPTPPNPHWVVFSADGGTFYTANHESGVVTGFDAATHTLVATVRVGQAPHSLAVSPDGTRLSVVNYESNTLSVIDTATHTVVQTIDVDLRPQDVTYAPDGAHVYTANVDAHTVDVISTATGVRTARIPTGRSPTSVSVSPDGRHAYVTNLDDGTIRVLDTAAV